MNGNQGLCLWLTGIPASGKSSISRELAALMRDRGMVVVVLESDEMRAILTPDPAYSEEERAVFYRQLALIASLLSRSGVHVILDATGNRRAYRDFLRTLINSFAEIHVRCPLEVCAKRDPKGLYARAALNKATTLPGIQASYEPPLAPELALDGQDDPAENAGRIMDYLKHRFRI